MKNTLFLKTFFLILSLSFIAQTGFSQTTTEKLDEFIGLYHEYGSFNGSVLVAQGGEVIYKKGFGMANMEWDIPNQSNTKHRLGSVTKQFTGMLILKLVDDGKIDLTASVSTYLPDYPQPQGEKVTIHHLLTHTSGIPNYTNFDEFRKTSINYFTPQDFIHEFSSLALEFTPGEKFSYSNSGYFLLGVIIEEVTGKSYEDNLDERIFAPLNMVNSGYDHFTEIIKNRATGYEKRGSGIINSDFLDMSVPYAAGSLYSTVEDLYLWDQALYGAQLLPKKLIELYFTPQIEAWGDAEYAYGFGIGQEQIGNTKESILVHSHGGGINGFNTIISRAPKDKTLIVLLNNTGGAPLNEMTIGIRGIIAGKTYDFPKKSVAQELLSEIEKEGLDSAQKLFAVISVSEDYQLSENEMNNAGYQLISGGKLTEAAAIFKMTINSFPESSNAYDSYAEAHMMLGNNELAIENFEKSIELNPLNQNGIDMLKKLGVDVSHLEVEIVISEKTLKSYEGRYELMPEFILSISTKDGKLIAQATGQQAIGLNAIAEDTFTAPEAGIKITFQKGKKNKIESLTLFQGGQEILGPKLAD